MVTIAGCTCAIQHLFRLFWVWGVATKMGVACWGGDYITALLFFSTFFSGGKPCNYHAALWAETPRHSILILMQIEDLCLDITVSSSCYLLLSQPDLEHHRSYQTPRTQSSTVSSCDRPLYQGLASAIAPLCHSEGGTPNSHTGRI